MGCTVYKDYCEEHGFVHGAEAEELRKGIEKIIEDESAYDMRLALVKLLDKVDARDSLAYIETLWRR